jgi:hypothetical protein
MTSAIHGRGCSDGSYQLIALGRPLAGEPTLAWRHLGHYPALDEALRGRVDDVLAQLAANDGWLVTVEHLVIGPGPDGPATVLGHITEIGADPAEDRVPDPYDEAGARRWLMAAHDLPT